MMLSEKERQKLLKIARLAIADSLEHGSSRPPDGDFGATLTQERGAFVTLRKRGELRGCIGHPLPVRPLYLAVHENALSAAFEDPRFPPLRLNELPDITIEISVLTLPRQVASPLEVKVGRDGIIVSKGWNRGLLLPQVPLEQGWGLEDYLSYGCLKAGLPEDEWKRGARIEIFQAEYFNEQENGGKA